MTNKYRFTSRTKARKRAADIIFEADQRGMGSDSRVLRDLLRERRVITAAQTPLPEYSVEMIEGVAQNLHRIDTLLTNHLKTTELDRIPATDLAIMRAATWEMLENSRDVPVIVAIDEAVAIARSISTDESPAFVNAVLDAVRKDIVRSQADNKSVQASQPQSKGDAATDDEKIVHSKAAEDTREHQETSFKSPHNDLNLIAKAKRATEYAASGEDSGSVSILPSADITADSDLEALDEILDEY